MNLQHLSIKELEASIDGKSEKEIASLLEAMKHDERKGVQVLLKRFWRLQEEKKARIQKAQRMMQEEGLIWAQGIHRIGGIDEAGRGPLAGPVVAACVILPQGLIIEGVDDSKKLTPEKRERLYDEIMEKALSVGVGRVGPQRIDSINILNATHEAMRQAVMNCKEAPEYLLVDALTIKEVRLPQRSLIKGDARSQSIAAASIIAKVTRDREMMIWHEQYPEYGFDKHKAYGTSEHIKVIKDLGLSPIHRRSFCINFME